MSRDARRLVVVLQDVLRRDTFGCYSDLVETLKVRCATLRIPYSAGLITDALVQVEQGGAKALFPPALPRRHVEQIPDNTPVFDKVTAAAICTRLKSVPRGVR